MSDMSKFVAAVVGMLAMAMVASRELFLFTVFRGSQGFLDSQGGRYHLLLAFSASVMSCLAGGLMFYFFLRHERNKRSKAPILPMSLRTAIGNNPYHNSVTRDLFDAVRWVQKNPWLSEGQADDRRPMNGSVADGGGTPSAQRAFARQSHQVMFKKWSQARHD